MKDSGSLESVDRPRKPSSGRTWRRAAFFRRQNSRALKLDKLARAMFGRRKGCACAGRGRGQASKVNSARMSPRSGSFSAGAALTPSSRSVSRSELLQAKYCIVPVSSVSRSITSM